MGTNTILLLALRNNNKTSGLLNLPTTGLMNLLHPLKHTFYLLTGLFRKCQSSVHTEPGPAPLDRTTMWQHKRRL